MKCKGLKGRQYKADEGFGFCCAYQIVLNVSCLDWLVLYKQLMCPLGIGINIMVTVNYQTTTDSSTSSTTSCDLRYFL